MTDNERLEREGKLDQASGAVKGGAEDAKDKFGEGVDEVRDRLRDDRSVPLDPSLRRAPGVVTPGARRLAYRSLGRQSGQHARG